MNSFLKTQVRGIGLSLAVVITTLGVTGCSDEEVSRGAIGAVGGAVVGGLLGNSSSAAAGAVVGGLIGAGTARDRGYDRRYHNRGYYRHGYYPPPPPHHVYGYSYRY